MNLCNERACDFTPIREAQPFIETRTQLVQHRANAFQIAAVGFRVEHPATSLRKIMFDGLTVAGSRFQKSVQFVLGQPSLEIAAVDASLFFLVAFQGSFK